MRAAFLGCSGRRDNMWLNDIYDWQGQSWMRGEAVRWGSEEGEQ